MFTSKRSKNLYSLLEIYIQHTESICMFTKCVPCFRSFRLGFGFHFELLHCKLVPNETLYQYLQDLRKFSFSNRTHLPSNGVTVLIAGANRQKSIGGCGQNQAA